MKEINATKKPRAINFGQGLKEKAATLVMMFVLFAMIGWIYEVVLAFIYGWGFTNRGFLWGPYLPVYGFGALILMGFLLPVMKKRRPVAGINMTPILVFFLIVIITSIIEYITGFAVEKILHTRLWDYSADWLNLSGYICPRTSFRFGLGGMVFLYLLTPIFAKLIGLLKAGAKNMVAIAIVLILLIDVAYTVFLR